MRRTSATAAGLMTALCLAALVTEVLGDFVRGEVLPLRQPDGTRLTVRIWGDEFHSIVETLDGYTLVREPATGLICYARRLADGDLVSTGVPAEQPAPADLARHLRMDLQRQAALARAASDDFEARRWSGPLAPPARARGARGPWSGEVEGLCLIIDFSDDVGTIPPANVANYCNQPGYNGNNNNGSVRDYFYDVSDTLLTYTNYVPGAYYRALHPKSYYTDPNIPYGQRARELIVEALNHLDQNGLNFSQFDADGDEIVDALNCFYAGYSESAWAEGLWPHAWSVYFCADGVCTQAYQMTDMQSQLRLSTFVHENGHMLLGWPDLYDYGYESTGVGQFCIMCYGTSATNPCEPCAYMKCRAEWIAPVELLQPQSGLSLPSGYNFAYRYSHPTAPNEYFLIENRQQTGRDSGLPDSGLALWHIDEYGSNNNEQQTPDQHYLVTLVQADGRWDLEHHANYGDPTDLFAAPAFTACTPDTEPNTNWWSGGRSELQVLGVSASGPVMTFDYTGEMPDCNGNGIPDPEDLGWGFSFDCNANAVPDECDIAAGTSTDCDANGTPDECQYDCDGNGVSDPCQLVADGGLVGMYYDTPDQSGPARARIDAQLNFDWGTGAPWPDFEPDTFSVHWAGYLKAAGSGGPHTLTTYSDDGVRLWLDGQLLIDHWVSQSPTAWSATVTLAAGSLHWIELDYFESGGGALVQLLWQPPGGMPELVPAARLMPAHDCNGNGLPDLCDIYAGSPDADHNGVPDDCNVLVGDVNCDGAVGLSDVNPFVMAFTSPAAYAQQYPDCPLANRDVNGDGLFNFGDLNPFVALLSVP